MFDAEKFSVFWLINHVLLPCDYGCDMCYRPDDLRIYNCELVCSDCYDSSFLSQPDIDWIDLDELPDLATEWENNRKSSAVGPK